MEQERLSAEAMETNDWNAVAALQATTIYILLRVSSEDEDHFDFDIQLIQTMVKLSQRVKGITIRYCDPALSILPTWEGWILVESLRRTLSTLFIIEFLFDLSPGRNYVTCNWVKDFGEMLLPSVKQLWTAQTRDQWSLEYEAQTNDRRPTFRELLLHDEIDSQHGKLLDQWARQVDDFGSLVMSAASLVDVVR